MGPEQYEIVFRTFLHCKDMGTPARDAYLMEHHGSDQEIRDCVESLIRASQSVSTEFLGKQGLMVQASLGVRELPKEEPEWVDEFRILRRIGRGGMGTVYEAEQASPKRRVAVKLIHSSIPSEDLVRRFKLEADVLARVHHPGIASIFQVGQYSGPSGVQPYFAMEFIEGVDIRSHSELHRLTLEDRLSLVAEVADAMHHAHECGVVHRDLKPENVLVDSSGRARVLDFGVARVIDESQLNQTAITETGQLIGTLNYMAPEQLHGAGDPATARADVYALGAILFELVSERRLHETSGLNLMAAISRTDSEDAPRLRRIANGIPSDVETIVGKALEIEPKRRYETASAFASDIRRFLGHRPILARPPGAIYLARRFTRRHRGLVTGVTMAFTVLLIALAALTRVMRGEKEARDKAEIAALQTLSVSHLSIDSLFEQGLLWRAMDNLDQIPQEMRGWEWRWNHSRGPLLTSGIQLPIWNGADPVYCIRNKQGRESVVLGDLVNWGNPAASFLSSDERISLTRVHASTLAAGVAYEGKGPEIHFIDLEQEKIKASLVHDFEYPEEGVFEAEDGYLRAANVEALAPQGSLGIAYDGEEISSYVVSHPEEEGVGRVDVRLDFEGRLGQGSDLSLDGRHALLTVNNVVSSFSAESGVRIAHRDDLECALARLSPDGTRVVACSRNGSTHVMSFPDLNSLQEFPRAAYAADPAKELPRVMTNAFWAGDRAILVASSNTNYLERIELATGESSRVDLGYAWRGIQTRALSSPDGRYVSSFAGVGRDVLIHDFETPDRGAFIELPYSGRVDRVAFTPQGDYFAAYSTRDPHIKVWDAWNGECVAQFPRAVSVMPAANRMAPLVFDASGRRLVTLEHDGGEDLEILIYDLLTGEVTRAERFSAVEAFRLPQEYVDALLSHIGHVPERLGPLLWRDSSQTGFLVAWDYFGDYEGPEDRPLRSYDLKSGQKLPTGITGIGTLSFSPDGRLFAAGGGDTIVLHDAESLEPRRGIILESCRALAWSPDQSRIAVGDGDGRVYLVETSKYQVVARLPPHEDRVNDLQWSPDGKRLVSCSADQTARLYNSEHPIVLRRREDLRELASDGFAELLAELERTTGSRVAAIRQLMGSLEGHDDIIAARRACIRSWSHQER